MAYRLQRLLSITALCLWAASLVCGIAALSARYGFDVPVAEPDTLRFILVTCAGLFLSSRVLSILPLATVRTRIARLLLDISFVVLALVMCQVHLDKQPFLLELIALYTIAIAIWTAGRCGMNALVDGIATNHCSRAAWRFILGAMAVTLIGGAMLALPVAWQGVHPYEADGPSYLLRRHVLDAMFTATAAITNTGLSPLDIGYEFSRFGQWVILGLMQLGGIAILVIGSAIGWRLRHAMGWSAIDDDLSAKGLRRLINFTVVLMLLSQTIGAVALYPMFDAERDTVFATAVQRSADSDPTWTLANIDNTRAFAATFHAVSAFNNSGLCLSRDGLMPYAELPIVYYVLLPLMILGSLGGPVLYETLRRLTFCSKAGVFATSRDTWVTLSVTALLIIGGGALVYEIESSYDYQQRYERDDTTRIDLSEAEDNLLISEDFLERQAAQRLYSMETPQRWTRSFYHVAAARSAAMRTVRLDEESLSPASRIVLMAAGLVGGGLGGTSGGLRIIVVLLCITAIRNRRVGRPARATPLQPIVSAASVLTVMVILIGATFFVLTYRETGSMEACLFESVNAACNSGFTTGLTPMLSVQGKITIALAMFCGRVLPIALLLPYLAYRWQLVEDQDALIARRLLETDHVVAIPEHLNSNPSEDEKSKVDNLDTFA